MDGTAEKDSLKLSKERKWDNKKRGREKRIYFGGRGRMLKMREDPAIKKGGEAVEKRVSAAQKDCYTPAHRKNDRPSEGQKAETSQMNQKRRQKQGRDILSAGNLEKFPKNIGADISEGTLGRQSGVGKR